MQGHRFIVRKAAVLGAGVMGAQIAAHLANADVPVLLFELAAREGDPNGNVLKAIDNLKRLEPSPLALPSRVVHIEPANYDQHLDALAECDLVIEAISERLDWKADLYRKVAPHIGPHAIFASNTSGLSINALAESLPPETRRRFCGVHFFNPPRYMHLVELIPAASTEPALLDELETFLVTTLGKGVVRAKDTPNFIANRVGVFSLLATIHHAQALGIPFDTVDALTGSLIGRPKSATFRTADVVGLDTFAHVVNTMKDTLPADPWHPYYDVPAWLKTLISQGALGQKTRKGVYQKVGSDFHVLDAASGEYRPSEGQADEKIAEILKEPDVAKRFEALHSSDHPQARFLWSVYRDVFHYCAAHLAEIAHNARDLDLAIRWGFGWDRGPFEIWQAAGWQRVARWIAEDVAAGKGMAAVPLPAWVLEPGRESVHTPQGSYSPANGSYEARPVLPVYRRQPFPAPLLGEPVRYGETIFETDAVRCWHTGDDIAIVSFKSKMHAIGGDVLEGVVRAIEEAEGSYLGLVIWQTEPPFSVGANLKKTQTSGERPKPSGLVEIHPQREEGSRVARAQGGAPARRRRPAHGGAPRRSGDARRAVPGDDPGAQGPAIPTVAAVDGLALGGGCEFIMHCDRAVATLESYIGLVEVGVGLLPAGGGCKEFAMRAAAEAKGGDIGPHIQRYFKTVAMGEVGRSAEHARELGYLKATDLIIMNRYELLHVAKAQIRALAEAGYRPPLKQKAIPVAGRNAIGTIKAFIVNMREGGQISQHDYLIGSKVAEVLCGGEIEGSSLVDENWLLELERRHFMELLATEKTQARIEHMLKNGKPLRN